MSTKKVSRTVYITTEVDDYLASTDNASALVDELVQKHKQENPK